jgi:hypothetical protein
MMPQDSRKPSNLWRMALPFKSFFARYFWIILKNVIGWLLILIALPIGGLFPGPLGTPIFLIGFALITFPGKRKLTSRILRGRPFDIWSRPLKIARIALSLTLPPLVVWIAARRHHSLIHPSRIGVPATATVYLLAIAGTWLLLLWLLRLMNLFISFMPRIRRKVRPWMKRHGINLLPPRRRRRRAHGTGKYPVKGDEEILEIHSPLNVFKRPR